MEAQAGTVLELIHEHVLARPSAPAIEHQGISTSFAEVDARADGVAAALRSRGVGPESMVGLSLGRTPDLVIGLLGILKAGAAGVPLDQTYPGERLRFMIQDTAAPVIITDDAGRSRFAETDAEVVTFDDVPSDGDPGSAPTPADLSMVIYTSGTTGRPKGVAHEHRSFHALMQIRRDGFGLEPGMRHLQFATLGSGGSILGILLSLSSGGTLCMSDRDSVMPGPALAATLRDLRIQHANLPAAALAMMPPTMLPDLSVIGTGGEHVHTADVMPWSEGRRLFHSYGISEVLWVAFQRVVEPLNPLGLGRPPPGIWVEIKDESGEPVPAGEPGEMYVGGVGLARGYHNRPDLTAERFVEDSKGRLYRTGDRGAQRDDRGLVHLGRVDHQVKVRGFRVELAEVESVLHDHPLVRAAAVRAWETDTGSNRLAAYVVPEDAGQRVDVWRDFLADRLPEYMIPASFVELDELPLSPNGKIDRPALPEPSQVRPHLSSDFAAPDVGIQRRLTEIWTDVLGISPIGVDDNFLVLGGESLQAIRIGWKVQETFGVDMPLSKILEAPTIRAMAAVLSQ